MSKLIVHNLTKLRKNEYFNRKFQLKQKNNQINV